MFYFIAILFVGFLVWAGGKETKWGGLGLLWRVSAWVAGISFLGLLILGLFIWNNEAKANKQYEEEKKKIALNELITETEDEYVGTRIKEDYPNSVYGKYTNKEVGSRAQIKRPDLYKKYIDEYYKKIFPELLTNNQLEVK